jgi:hypothetical protein
MELRITNPQESWLTEQILWNNEELKAAIAEKVKDYKTIAYTEDSLKDMKADRADLNKLKKAFEDERKRVKKICMEPYTKFEQQVKEITALIDEPIGLTLRSRSLMSAARLQNGKRSRNCLRPSVSRAL